MARKGPVSLQDTVETNEEFNNYIEAHRHQLICMEVYSEFCGPCQATSNAIKKAKLEIGMDDVAMVKACADKIDALKRFQYKSEPAFLFLQDGKLSRAMFGANGIELCRLVELEIGTMKAGAGDEPKYEIEEMLPMEAEKLEEELKSEEEHKEAEIRMKRLAEAARKKRVCERMSEDLRRFNFVMFWPHNHQAHYDLYGNWDNVGVQVVAKETFQLNEEALKEVLYMSDIELNEACVHSLVTGEVLVTVFKIDSDTKDIVKVMRRALYEDIPVPNEDLPPEKQLPPIPAYERYASISKTAREVRRDRYEAKLEKLRKEQEERDRLAAEQARLAQQAAEEAEAAAKQKAEDERMERIAQGLPPDPEPEAVEEAVAEEIEAETTEAPTETETDIPPGEPEPEQEPEPPEPEAEEVFHSDVEEEDEDYIPPGGLFVPGLYCPPNDLAKVSGLAYFFPKLISAYTSVESSKLPPHVLVMFTADKRNDVNELVKLYRDEILNIGIFKGDDPNTAEHVAYSVKQYEKMFRPAKHYDRVAVMVSRKRSLPLLQLAGLNPCYISLDADAGERECLLLFPVGYGDDFVEEESVKEEEIPEVVEKPVEVEPEVVAEELVEEEEDEDDG